MNKSVEWSDPSSPLAAPLGLRSIYPVIGPPAPSRLMIGPVGHQLVSDWSDRRTGITGNPQMYSFVPALPGFYAL